MNFPTENALPIEIVPEFIPDLIRMSEIIIFTQHEYLIFSNDIH